MKTLSVLFTFALVIAANQLAVKLKQAGALPQHTQAISKTFQTSDTHLK
jgi:hypothetical protein